MTLRIRCTLQEDVSRRASASLQPIKIKAIGRLEKQEGQEGLQSTPMELLESRFKINFTTNHADTEPGIITLNYPPLKRQMNRMNQNQDGQNARSLSERLDLTDLDWIRTLLLLLMS